MAQQQDPLAALHEIRSLMERSARFTSLSGLSGIVVGLVALVGVGLIYWHLDQRHMTYPDVYNGTLTQETSHFLLLVAAFVLLLAVGSVISLTWFKAQRDQQSIWQDPGQRMFANLCLPLVVGGVFCLVLLYHNLLYLVAPSMLIFYGLAQINGSKYAFPDLRYLGLCEVAIGLLACFQIEYGLVAWAVGFGGLNILYGTLLYYKYEKRR
ncbi:MAG: hypothetical protein EOO39_03120 [Cytophagaceae bacterium]|nr:MAG: hypothetical protein EOO39_03120 [Cytophagaceae bacterium]